MSAENQDRARLIVPGDPRMPPDRSAGELRHVVTLALDAAELRGHTKAVEETAIHSIHKAVAAERAAIVAFLRAGAAVADHQIEECRLASSFVICSPVQSFSMVVAPRGLHVAALGA